MKKFINSLIVCFMAVIFGFSLSACGTDKPKDDLNGNATSEAITKMSENIDFTTGYDFQIQNTTKMYDIKELDINETAEDMTVNTSATGFYKNTTGKMIDAEFYAEVAMTFLSEEEGVPYEFTRYDLIYINNGWTYLRQGEKDSDQGTTHWTDWNVDTFGYNCFNGNYLGLSTENVTVKDFIQLTTNQLINVLLNLTTSDAEVATTSQGYKIGANTDYTERLNNAIEVILDGIDSSANANIDEQNSYFVINKLLSALELSKDLDDLLEEIAAELINNTATTMDLINYLDNNILNMTGLDTKTILNSIIAFTDFENTMASGVTIADSLGIVLEEGETMYDALLKYPYNENEDEIGSALLKDLYDTFLKESCGDLPFTSLKNYAKLSLEKLPFSTLVNMVGNSLIDTLSEDITWSQMLEGMAEIYTLDKFEFNYSILTDADYNITGINFDGKIKVSDLSNSGNLYLINDETTTEITLSPITGVKTSPIKNGETIVPINQYLETHYHDIDNDLNYHFNEGSWIYDDTTKMSIYLDIKGSEVELTPEYSVYGYYNIMILKGDLDNDPGTPLETLGTIKYNARTNCLTISKEFLTALGYSEYEFQDAHVDICICFRITIPYTNGESIIVDFWNNASFETDELFPTT